MTIRKNSTGAKMSKVGNNTKVRTSLAGRPCFVQNGIDNLLGQRLIAHLDVLQEFTFHG